MTSRSIFVGTTGQLTHKRYDPGKNGTSDHPNVDTFEVEYLLDFMQYLPLPHIPVQNMLFSPALGIGEIVVPWNSCSLKHWRFLLTE
jgi:hypothetical protein